MKSSTIQDRINEVVKNLQPSGYKMGDIFTLTVEVNRMALTASHDAREWYQGSGSKFNKSVKHGEVNVLMTLPELNKAYKPIAIRIKEKKASEKSTKLYLNTCNETDKIAQAASKAVNIIGRRRFESYGLTEEQYIVSQYNDDGKGLDGFHAQPDAGYRGCGVYRVGWKDEKMTCTLYGGFHDSKPYGVDETLWVEAVEAEMKKYANHIVKMDGSGCEFFFRNFEDADLVTMATEVYTVPSSLGGAHLNIQPAQASLVEPNQITV